MSLATRCPVCQTVFRVVQDQLKVSEGWVRCGRCAEVFNAAQALFELEAAGPAGVAAQADASAARAADVAPAPPIPTTEATRTDRTTEVVETAEAIEAAEAAHREAAAARRAAVAAAEARTEPASPLPPPPGEEAAALSPTPEFIRRADRAAQRGPRYRGALALCALGLLALLAAQIGVHYRDHVAAVWPAARPVLQAACGLLCCEVEAPRRIDSLHVDSSGLVRIESSALYRLSLVVRNKAPTPVRMPAVELTLTDAQGLTTARRVFGAAELGQPARSLPAGGELPLQATLDLGEQRVAGYTVELFYP
jgi:predicted Zn finger-like uncharacterized protein